ncbi:MAG: 2'-5' RNA ligase family protein [Sphingomicrobium sp.]
MAGALIVTAELGGEDFAWLDRQRRAYFPPERNQLGAHLTMFHALPPSLEDEARERLKLAATANPPRGSIAGLINLGGGVAYRVQSEELEAIRAEIADHFHGALTAQDSAGWRAHVTVQNKVAPAKARLLFENLQRGFRPRALAVHGIALHRYLGGPWQPVGDWPFRL